MSSDIVQANYEALEAVAAHFGQQADLSAELSNQVRRSVEVLESGSWMGKGSQAFFAEMNGAIFPALQRLTHALQEARAVTLEAKAILQQAEEEAARAFQGDRASTGAYRTDVQSGAGTSATNGSTGGLPSPPPDPPPPPAGDGSGKHGAVERNWFEQRFDDAQKNLWYAVANGADLAGLDDAARHMRHYLDNSGEDLTISPRDIINDLPDFKQRAEAAFQADILDTVNQRIAAEYTGDTMRFQLTSNWRSYAVGQPDIGEQLSNEGNWFYALGGFSYSYGADVTVTPGVDGKPQVTIEYQMHVFDRYNWDAGKGVDIAGIPTPDTALGHLHQVGIAQEYNIRGSSDPTTITYNYSENSGDIPGASSVGNPTRDTLISRDEVISRDDPRLDTPVRDE